MRMTITIHDRATVPVAYVTIPTHKSLSTIALATQQTTTYVLFDDDLNRGELII